MNKFDLSTEIVKLKEENFLLNEMEIEILNYNEINKLVGFSRTA